ncbi:MAG: DUF885 domain-containing protein [Oceanicaulis sp.]
MIQMLTSGAAAAALLSGAGFAHETHAPAVSFAATQAAEGSAEQTESVRLNAWFQQVFEAEIARSPQAMTALGMVSDMDAYGRWDDNSDAAAIENFERSQAYVQEMRDTFDYDALTDEAKLSYDFFVLQAENDARQHAVRESRYAFSPMGDAVSGLVTFMINNHRVASAEHAEAYVSRLEGMDEQIDLLTERALRRAENGVRLPLFAYPRLESSATALITGYPYQEGEDSALYADFKEKVEALELEADAEAALLADARAALTGEFQPAVERYIAALGEMEAGADERAGIWKLPNGEQAYAASLAQFTTRTDLSAEDIHQIGLSEVERIHAEMRAIMDEVGFEGSLSDFFEFMRTDPQFQLPDTEEGRQQYLDRATEVVDRVMEAAPAFFDTLPSAELEVRKVEPWREATATGAFYSRPALDGSRPGYYYVNLANMADNPTYLLESLSLHEGAPGHHFQIALAQELQDVPLFQRLAWNSAYGEGWALYTEWLGKEMGFYEDPYSDFGRLSYEVFRAVRLVVDTGLHHHRWTREEAIEYMLANTPMTEGDITPEVERYIVWPGQAVSYKIGMITIQDLLARAQGELGADFRWGGFHDAVLTAGPLPLPLLEQRVESWIASVKAGE